jgi:preprotein translocase subunit SecE
MKVLKRIVDYLKNVYLELRKVTWPTRNELVSSTVVVIIVSVFVAVVIFILDMVFTSILGLVLR